MRISDTPLIPRHKRSERFFAVDDQWYFNSREGIRFGGYATRFDAELGAHLMFVRISQADSAAEVHAVMAHFVSMPLGVMLRPSAGVNHATTFPTALEPSRRSLPAFRRWLESTRVRNA